MRHLLYCLLAATFVTPAFALSCDQDGVPPDSEWLRPSYKHTNPYERPIGDQYLSRVLAVTVNDVAMRGSSIILQRPCGRMLVPEKDWNSWRLLSHQDDAVMIGDIWYLDLANLAGVSFYIDQPEERLLIQAIPERFAKTIIDWNPYRPQAAGPEVPGAFVNATVGASGSSVSDEYIWSTQATAGIFGLPGVLTTDHAWFGRKGSSDGLRLRTVFTKDWELPMWRLEIGDVFSRSGLAGLGSFVGGVRFAREFSTQPSFSLRPRYRRELLLDQTAQVRMSSTLWGEELTSAISGQAVNLPTGPVEFINLPYESNSDLHVLIADAQGNTDLITSRMFLRSQLLRAGVSDFEFVAGLYRQGGISDEYSTLMSHAYGRYGLSDDVSVAAQAVVSEHFGLLGLGTDIALPYIGVLGLDQVTSDLDGRRGELLRLSLFNHFRHWGWGYSQEWYDEEFQARPGLSNNLIQTRLQLRLNAMVPTRLQRQSIGAAYRLEHRRDGEVGDSIHISLPLSTGRWYTRLGFTQTLRPERQWAVGLSLSLPLEKKKSRSRKPSAWSHSRLNLGMQLREGEEVTGTLGASTGQQQPGSSWRLGASSPLQNGASGTNLGFNWRAERWSANAGFSNIFDEPLISASASSGLTYLGGRLLQSRSTLGSWAVVDLGPNGAGALVNGFRADDKGRAVIPELVPYYPFQVQVNFRDLPMRANLESDSIQVVPRYRSAISVKLPLQLRSDVMFRAIDRDGNNLLLGSEVTGVGITTRVGYDGLVYLRRSLSGNMTLQVNNGLSQCRIELRIPESSNATQVPDLGVQRCD